ncbi:hypothetical protein L2E82_15313 [Cichorium intybus]|uniref:Uncharacterized protein n=1 Tax=Cichorium intybus TaxID=13427 RepID=A0ACB9F311_CICIN|nr:hypothetical protein L2E82_15313 [Cichorium intybus]
MDIDDGVSYKVIGAYNDTRASSFTAGGHPVLLLKFYEFVFNYTLAFSNLREKVWRQRAIKFQFYKSRTGRSNPAMLDKLEVEYYGSPVNLKTIAQISTPDSSSLLVQPYDKSSLKELSKIVAKQAEEGKVAIRNIRRDAIKSYDKLEKEKKLLEDNVQDLSAALQMLKIVQMDLKPGRLSHISMIM